MMNNLFTPTPAELIAELNEIWPEGNMPTMQCHCGLIYKARAADLKRGWGLSCSKSCAAVRRDFGRKPAKQIDGEKVKKTKAKPSSYRPNDNRRYDDGLGYTYEKYLDELHPFSEEAIQG